MKYLLIPLALCIVGCNDNKKQEVAVRDTDNLGLDSLPIWEVHPTSGPGVYMEGGGRLWYVEGTTGMAVRTANGQTIDPCTVVPTSGRGVYVEDCSSRSGYWYVIGAQAFNIREVASREAMDTIPSELGTVVWAHIEQRRMARQQEEELRELGEELDHESRDPRY